MIAGFNKILIVGLGLIGSSIAGALKSVDPKLLIFGKDSDETVVDEAISRGLIEDCRSIDYENLDLVILASPLETFDYWFSELTANSYEGIITDVGSAKLPVVCEAKKSLKNSKNFIPGHPMAGREKGGLKSAKNDLFDGAYWILTPDEKTDIDAFRRLHELITSIGARVISVDAAEHDKLIAIVSHVPHVAASSLVMLAASHSDQNGELFRLAAGGFKDTTRVAAGDPTLWRSILMSNSELIADELSELKDIISRFEKSIRDGDEKEIEQMLSEAAEARKSIPSKWVPESAELVEINVLMDNRPGIIAEITAIAGRKACNIQAIDIDHQSESNAILRLVLTDEGDIEGFLEALKQLLFDVEIVKKV